MHIRIIGPTAAGSRSQCCRARCRVMRSVGSPPGRHPRHRRRRTPHAALGAPRTERHPAVHATRICTIRVQVYITYTWEYIRWFLCFSLVCFIFNNRQQPLKIDYIIKFTVYYYIEYYNYYSQSEWYYLGNRNNFCRIK